MLAGHDQRFLQHRKNRLKDEIDELRLRTDAGRAPPSVQRDAVDAIDHVRALGNIGAHMEKDINLIVDIDPDEAQKIIGLIELLFVEWYTARERRREGLAALGVLATEKKALTEQGKLPAPEANAGSGE